MRKPWQTREWKEKRAEFIKGKSCEWCGSTEYLTIDHNQPPNTQNEEDYLAFKDVTVLCRRCSFARLNGFDICGICKKYIKRGHYYKLGNHKTKRKSKIMCQECFDKTPEGVQSMKEMRKFLEHFPLS